jgi:hypothetical protein
VRLGLFCFFYENFAKKPLISLLILKGFFRNQIMGPALQTAIIVFCIIMSAYFSATETAFSTFNRIRVKGLAEKGNKRAATALKLSENYDTLISAILIGNNIVNILATSLATILLVNLIGDLGATVSTIVMTVAVLIFGEISPKTIAKKKPEAFVLFAAPIIKAITVILVPFTYLFKQWQNRGRAASGDFRGGLLRRPPGRSRDRRPCPGHSAKIRRR